MTKNAASSTSATKVAIGLVLTVLAILGIDQGGALFLDWAYKRSTMSPLVRIKLSGADTLVLGSSTAKYAIDTEHFLANSLNAGEDGQGVFYTATILRALPEGGAIKRVVAMVDPGGLIAGFNSSNLKHLWRYAPLSRDHPRVRKWLEASDPWASVKLLSGLVTYRSVGREVVKEWLRPRKQYYAYEPLVGQAEPINVTPEIDDTAPAPVSLEGLKLLDSMAEDAKRLQIQLIVAVSPFPGYLREEQTRYADVFSSMRDRLSGVGFCDLTKSAPKALRQFILDPQYFWDGPHLNETGAQVYSRILAERIETECRPLSATAEPSA